MNLGAFLTRTAERHPARTALSSNGRRTSYAEMNERVDALAAGLTDCGLRAGDRVVRDGSLSLADGTKVSAGA